MATEKDSLLTRLKREGPKEVALEAARWVFNSTISPWFAPIWIGAVAIASATGAWFSGVDPFVKWVFFLLAVGAALWITNQIRVFFRRTPDDNSQTDNAHDDGEKLPALVLGYCSKRPNERTDTESGPRGNFHVLRCYLQNNSEKTISNITMSVACRSWRRSLLTTHHDTRPGEMVFNRNPLSLNPHEGIEFIFFSQNADNAEQLYLGDHKDEDARRIENIPKGDATHFITIAVGATDIVPTFKNLVVLTLNPPRLIGLEFDSRRWGHHGNSPSALHVHPTPRQ